MPATAYADQPQDARRRPRNVVPTTSGRSSGRLQAARSSCQALCRTPWQSTDDECQRVPGPSRSTIPGARPEGPVPTYQYACTECGHAFEQCPELHRRLADRVPRVRGPAAQGLQRRGRGVQGLGLLPHRQPVRLDRASAAARPRAPRLEGSSTRPPARRRRRTRRRPRPRRDLELLRLLVVLLGPVVVHRVLLAADPSPGRARPEAAGPCRRPSVGAMPLIADVRRRWPHAATRACWPAAGRSLRCAPPWRCSSACGLRRGPASADGRRAGRGARPRRRARSSDRTTSRRRPFAPGTEPSALRRRPRGGRVLAAPVVRAASRSPTSACVGAGPGRAHPDLTVRAGAPARRRPSSTCCGSVTGST